MLNFTRISKTLELPGYILDTDILKKIHETCINIVRHKNRKKVEQAYWIEDKGSNKIKFESFEKLLSYTSSEKTGYATINLKYVISDEVGISIEFTHKGKIELSAYGNAPDFQFNIDQLIREIQKCEQEYNSVIKNFVVKRDLSRVFLIAIFGVSLLLLYSIGYYSYAKNVGVNINPSVIPSGNQYYKQVEEAIQSDDISEKLNVLLTSQLKGFTNVQDILQRQQNFSVFLLITLAILTALFFLARFLNKLYPLAFFEFEPHKKTLANIYRKRDIVWVGVILGFVVNIVAGIVIALLE